MTRGRGDSAAPAAAEDFLRDWQAVRDDASIQFEPLPEPKAPEPGWLDRFVEWLGEILSPVGQALNGLMQAIGLSLPALGWMALALAVALAIWLAARHLRAALPRREPEPQAGWAPDRAAALDLLGEAERLAGEGRYGEAAHLLLQRSVEQIAETRPELLRPSSTAREIAALPALGEAAREAFSTIAARVERCLFALRPLDAADWRAAREAYARFALGPA